MEHHKSPPQQSQTTLLNPSQIYTPEDWEIATNPRYPYFPYEKPGTSKPTNTLIELHYPTTEVFPHFCPRTTPFNLILPAELRALIWKYSLPPPRVIYLTEFWPNDDSLKFGSDLEFKIDNYTVVCREQYSEFWKNYRWLDENGSVGADDIVGVNGIRSCRVLVDFQRDTLTIQLARALLSMNNEDGNEIPSCSLPACLLKYKVDLSLIQHLAVRFTPETWQNHERPIAACEVALQMRGIKTLTLVSLDRMMNNYTRRVIKLVEIVGDGDHFMRLQVHSSDDEYNCYMFKRLGREYYNNIHDRQRRTVVRRAIMLRERASEMINTDLRYYSLRENSVQLKVSVAATFSVWPEEELAVEVVPKGLEYAGEPSHFIRGYVHRGVEIGKGEKIVTREPKLWLCALIFEGLKKCPMANYDGTMKVQTHGIEDVRRLFEE